MKTPVILFLLVAIFFATPTLLFSQQLEDFYVEAITALKSGNCPEAFATLSKILDTNPADTFAHLLMSTTLLMGGKINDAQNEINYILDIYPNNADALYLNGIIKLSQKDIQTAKKHFESAAAKKHNSYITPAIDYINRLTSNIQPESESDISLAINAMDLMRDIKYAESFEIWKKLQKSAARDGFGEQIGFTGTFTPSAPITITGWQLGKKTYTQKDVKTVSGNLTLKADVTNAENVTMVSFMIDGKLHSVTNIPPFIYNWDTTLFSNGRHLIYIEGMDDLGNVLTETTAEVFVKNKISSNIQNSNNPLYEKFYQIITLRPSAAFINYNVAVTAQGKTPAEKQEICETALERVLAANPNYLDSQEKLSKHYGFNKKCGKIYTVETARKVVALTFDDGPKEETEKILAILREKNVKATFFLVGTQALKFPEIVKKIHDEGHQIENHTFSHRDLEYLTESDIIQELFKNIAVIRSITGRRMQFMRPPGGHEGTLLSSILDTFCISSVFWTVNGSKFEGTSKNEFLRKITSSVTKNGSIILLHNPESVTILALGEIIDNLRQRGFSFETLSELTIRQ